MSNASATIEARVPARIGLLGNPSDGYEGACIALAMDNFGVEASLRPTGKRGLSIRCGQGQARAWERGALALAEAPGAVADGGTRLALAAVQRLAASEAAIAARLRRDDAPGFALELQTDIPRQVGLAGSSALVIATLRVVVEWCAHALSPHALAELALATEVETLGIAAGPMDRVIQAYGGALFMDFEPPRSPRHYRRIPLESVPPLWIAWDPRGAEASGDLHGPLRERWRQREPAVLASIARLRAIASEGEAALHARDASRLRTLMNRNFDERAGLVKLPARDFRLVALARDHGAAAKLCGSGGAVVVAPSPAGDTTALAAAYREAGYECARVVPHALEHDPTEESCSEAGPGERPDDGADGGGQNGRQGGGEDAKAGTRRTAGRGSAAS